MRQIAVIGLGRFGSSLAIQLADMGCDVMGIDKDEARVNALASVLAHTVTGDGAEEETLRSLGIGNFDCVIVAIGHELQASILVTLMLKEMGVGMVVAKASTELHGKVLERVGADRVVFPERDMGVRVAHMLLSSDILDFIQLSPEYGILEVVANREFRGRSLKDLDLRSRYGIMVLAIRSGTDLKISPGGDDVIRDDDILVLVGETQQIARLEKQLVKNNGR